jgi:hypothetical protein
VSVEQCFVAHGPLENLKQLHRPQTSRSELQRLFSRKFDLKKKKKGTKITTKE